MHYTKAWNKCTFYDGLRDGLATYLRQSRFFAVQANEHRLLTWWIDGSFAGYLSGAGEVYERMGGGICMRGLYCKVMSST